MLDRMVVTIAPDERLELHRQLLTEQPGEVAGMPLYWDVDPVLVARGVKTVGRNGGGNTGNMHEWDKD